MLLLLFRPFPILKCHELLILFDAFTHVASSALHTWSYSTLIDYSLSVLESDTHIMFKSSLPSLWNLSFYSQRSGT